MEASETILHVQRANKSMNIIMTYLKVHQYMYVLKQSEIACFSSEKEPMDLPQIYKKLVSKKHEHDNKKKISQAIEECISEVSERFHMF